MLVFATLGVAGCKHGSPVDRAFTAALEAQQEADAARAQGQTARAETKLRQAVENYAQVPESGPKLNNLALAEANLGDISSAIEGLKKANDPHDPQWPVYARNLGDLYVASGRWREAAQEYEAILRAWPIERETHAKLQRLYVLNAPAEVEQYLALAKNLNAEGATMVAAGVLGERTFAAAAPAALAVLADAFADRVPFEPMNQLRTEATNVCTVPAPCSELELLLSGARRPPETYKWWLDSARNITIRRAFVHLMEAVGSRAATEGRSDAEVMLRDAVAASDAGDLRSATALIDFYSGAGWSIRYINAAVRERTESAALGAREYHEAVAIAYIRVGEWYGCIEPWHGAMFHIDRAAALGSTALARFKAGARPDTCGRVQRSPEVAAIQSPQTDAKLASASAAALQAKVYFGFDKPKIDDPLQPDCLSTLATIVMALRSDPAMHVTLKGYTDEVGTVDYNQQLSVRRAETVRDCLVTKGGIELKRITAQGFGKCCPVSDLPFERHLNRRVECVVTK